MKGDAAIIALGSIIHRGIRAYDDEDALPVGARLIIVAVPFEHSAALVERLRARYVDVQLMAWLPALDEKRVSDCVAAGFDAVAMGEAHLDHCVSRWSRDLELAEANATQSEIHHGLVSLITEINSHPELGEVLCTAVLRLSELFSIDRVSVVLFKPGDEIAFVVAEHEESLIDNLVIRVDDYPELRAVMGSHEPLVITDVLGDTLLSGVRSKLEHAKQTPRASVLFTLLHKDEVVGALFLRDSQPLGSVEERLMHMGKLIAAVTSVAIGAALEQDTLLSEHRALRRKKAEADERVAGLQQFSNFFAQANDGIVVTDDDGVIRYANEAAGSILRCEVGELGGKRFVELLNADSHVLARRAIRGDQVGDSYGYIDLLVPVEGEQEIVISAAIRALEQPNGVLVSFRDVTELREIETELRQTKEFLENLIQSSVDAIVAADINGRIILFNRAAEDFLGYSARDVVGKMNVARLYPPGEARDVMRRLRSEAFGGAGRLEMTRKDLVSKHGILVPVNLTASVIYEGEREIATVGIFTDLRELLKMEEKLSQVQRRLKNTERQVVAVELAGATAHELNQPLTSILGYAEMLRRRIPEGDANRKPVDVIYRETDRMAQIVRRIGQITAYETKAYVGSSKILDFGSQDSSVDAEKSGQESLGDTDDESV